MSRRRKRGQRVRVDAALSVICPCGQQVHAGYDQDGAGVVIHREPRCAEFDALDPDEFLRWMRLKREGKLDA